MLILAHSPTWSDLAVLAALVLLAPVGTTLMMWWLDPRRWISLARPDRVRSALAAIVAALPNLVTTIAFVWMNASRRSDVIGMMPGPVAEIVATLLPGTLVALLAILALEELFDRWSARAKPRSLLNHGDGR